MKTETIYKQGKICGNKQFRYCDSDVNTHKCINCGYSFGEEVSVGETYVGECSSCDFIKEVVCDSHGVAYNKKTGNHDGESFLYGTCHECKVNNEAISELYNQFREGIYGRDKEYNFISNEKFLKDREDALEKIVNLPKEQQKNFLRSIYSTVER